MDKVDFGKTGMSLTKFGFGGIPVQRLSPENASELMVKAFELGMNWIDTANSYGHSEETTGLALQDYGRDGIYVFSKAQGDTAELIREQVYLSLERMGLSFIDLYQLHLVRSIEDWNRKIDNGTVDMLIELKNKGIINHIGASAHKLDVVLKIMDHPAIESVQFPFNFIAEDIGIKALVKANNNGIGFIAMKPFGGGMINNAEAAVHFLLEYPSLVSDPGFEKVEEIKQVIKYSEESGLTEDDKKDIILISDELGTKFCRRCEYCSPCPQGVNIVKLMTLESMIKRLPGVTIFSDKNSVEVESVKKCIKCGLCESKCPYNLKITERIIEGALLYQKLKSSAG